MTTPPDPNTVRHISAWLNQMSGLARHPNDEKPAAKSLALIAGMLATEFPIEAFTITSMQSTLRGNVFFPLYEETRRCVREWWEENRPAPVNALQGPAEESSGLSGMDAHWLSYWHRRIGEIAAGPEWQGSDPSQAPRAHLASLIRQHSPAAWRVISGGEPAWPERSVGDITAAVGDALRAGAPNTPKSGTQDAQQAAVASRTGREAPVSPEALAALRAARGIAA